LLVHEDFCASSPQAIPPLVSLLQSIGIDMTKPLFQLTRLEVKDFSTQGFARGVLPKFKLDFRVLGKRININTDLDIAKMISSAQNVISSIASALFAYRPPSAPHHLMAALHPSPVSVPRLPAAHSDPTQYHTQSASAMPRASKR
jgi:hypothetical protein